MVEVLILVAAYLIGSVPSAYLVVRIATGKDVRHAGSHNVGATNTVRAAGLGAGVLVGFLDIAKGTVPVVVMVSYSPASRWVGAAALMVVIGHCFPIWLAFRGGKGVATAIGAFVPLAPWALLCGGAVWWATVAISRRVAVASIAFAVTLPLFAVLVERVHRDLAIAATVVASVIVIRHSENIRRLLHGEEPRIGESRGRRRWQVSG